MWATFDWGHFTPSPQRTHAVGPTPVLRSYGFVVPSVHENEGLESALVMVHTLGTIIF